MPNVYTLANTEEERKINKEKMIFFFSTMDSQHHKKFLMVIRNKRYIQMSMCISFKLKTRQFLLKAIFTLS